MISKTMYPYGVLLNFVVYFVCLAGCGREGAAFFQDTLRDFVVSQVSIRQEQTVDSFGKFSDTPALALVKRIIDGDTAGVDVALSQGGLDINEILCLTFNDNIRRRRIDLAKTQFKPPYMGNQNFSPLNYCYKIDSSTDVVLDKNDVIQFYGTPLMLAARRGDPVMVAFLLKRGANPNVFIPVKGVTEQMARREIGLPSVLAGRRPFVVLCALTDCYVETFGKTVESGDECADLLIKQGAVMPPENEAGQTALWAAAQVRSVFLLKEFIQMGADVNHKDLLGMTVADYVSREMATAPGESLKREYEIFLQALSGYGVNTHGGDSNAPSRMRNPDPNGQVNPTYEISSNVIAAKERLAEIAAIEAELKGLRVQLAEAKHDANMNAITGTAAFSVRMRVRSLIDAIHERERRLAALQECSASSAGLTRRQQRGKENK
ncbi:MAG: ankyrin repeat domain-containing protein [Kiritimatiellae bacterium]|nr:ankyrin repeat domain-containing protein [Kiritimatiellia bacterium]